MAIFEIRNYLITNVKIKNHTHIEFQFGKLVNSTGEWSVVVDSQWRIQKNKQIIVSSYFEIDIIKKHILQNFENNNLKSVNICKFSNEIIINVADQKLISFCFWGNPTWIVHDNKNLNSFFFCDKKIVKKISTK